MPETKSDSARRVATVLLSLGLLGISSGCSIKKLAVNKVGDALAAGGTTFSSDDDPELIRAAVPFSLKLMESLLAESPRHKGLLFATASGFTQYAYAFVQLDADLIEATDFAAAEAMRERARKLYLRARNYGLRGLDARYKRFEEELRLDPKRAVASARARDVPLLYWTAASWGSAISLSKDDPELIKDVPQVEAMIDRALELDPDWSDGAIHAFLITYEMARQGSAGEAAERSTRHFERALALARGRLAGPYVAMAEAVSVQKQDLEQFDSMLAQALAVDPNAAPDYRLVNLVMQRRARWLQSRREDLFLVPEPSATP